MLKEATCRRIRVWENIFAQCETKWSHFLFTFRSFFCNFWVPKFFNFFFKSIDHFCLWVVFLHFFLLCDYWLECQFEVGEFAHLVAKNKRKQSICLDSSAKRPHFLFTSWSFSWNFSIPKCFSFFFQNYRSPFFAGRFFHFYFAFWQFPCTSVWSLTICRLGDKKWTHPEYLFGF